MLSRKNVLKEAYNYWWLWILKTVRRKLFPFPSLTQNWKNKINNKVEFQFAEFLSYQNKINDDNELHFSSYPFFFKKIVVWLKNWLIKQWNFQTLLPKFHLKPPIHNFFLFLSTRNKDLFHTQTQKHDWKASWKNCLGPVPIPFLFFSLNMLSKPYSSTMATSLYIYS